MLVRLSALVVVAGLSLALSCSDAETEPVPPAPGGSGGTAGAGGTPTGTAGGGVGGEAGSGGGGTVEPQPNESSPLGTNLNGIADWSTEYPFVDAFKTSRPWISGNSSEWDDGRPFDVDEHGWILSLDTDQIARTLLFWMDSGRYPSGQYVVLYEGAGTIEYWNGATKNDSLSSAGRDVIDVDSQQGGIGINITAVDTAHPLRNIRVIMPGGVCTDDPFVWCESDADCSETCEPFEDNYETQIFHPTFLDRIKTYRLLRYMDWMDTNNSTLADWEDRPEVADVRWREHGVPVEIMVDLANRLSADPWFCMPHLATDDFVSQFASYVEANLRSGLRAYVEYSNEVWNGMFDQADHARTQGLALALSTSDYEAQLRYCSRRAVEIFDLWEQAFGGTDRLYRVMAAQSANTWTGETELSFENAAQSSDALGIAPYFGWNASPSDAGTIAAMTADDLAARIENEILPGTIQHMVDNKAVADQYGVELVAYEGGQHFVGVQGGENDDAINSLFDAINRDSRMGTFYTTYLDAWRTNGGSDFAHFVNCGGWSKWGRWGALEYQDQPRADSPKWDALQDFIENHDKWW